MFVNCGRIITQASDFTHENDNFFACLIVYVVDIFPSMLILLLAIGTRVFSQL